MVHFCKNTFCSGYFKELNAKTMGEGGPLKAWLAVLSVV